MRVLLIGAGRYGNNLVGRKYACGELGVKLAGVVDPKIDKIKNGAHYYMKGVPEYHSLEEIPYGLTKDLVADIALIPQIVPEIFGKIANMGIKKVILPKPVTTNYEDYKKICSIARDNNMHALVASNWHYSDITKNLKNLIHKIKTGNFETPTDKKITNEIENCGYDINKIFVEYSKKDETLDIDPPLQELPHALQILLSSELLNKFKGVKTTLDKCLQSKSRVNLKMTNVDNIQNGIFVNSDLKSGDKLQANRVRKVEILLNKPNGNNAKITADYDAVFDADGNCKKYPEIVYEYTNDCAVQKSSCLIKEDNINKMYDEIYKAFSGRESNPLTINDYKPLAHYLSDIEKKWIKKV